MRRNFIHRIPVRDGDCDRDGFVTHARYVDYLGMAHAALWREALDERLLDGGCQLDLMELQVRYLGLAELDQELDFEVQVMHIGAASVETAIDARMDGRQVVTGRARYAFIDPEAPGDPEMPERVREGLMRYVHEHAEPTGTVARP